MARGTSASKTSPSADSANAEFQGLVDAHYKPLYRFALSLCGAEGTACDLVQQTFFTWAAKGHQLRDRSKAKSWLFTTLHREFLQLIRRDSRLVPLPDSHDEPDPACEPPPRPDSIDGLDAADLHAALAEVPETFRDALTLFYLEEFSYAEIAEILEVPIGTVMSRLSRGKQKLRKRLKLRLARKQNNLVNFQFNKEANDG
ncbi:MAG: RNA polymerase sigma factor [Verrucomicrobia bacterium]|nr:MAG: RNA polymerase sigma factor [Verrucomicrobiota bacterium]